VGVEYGPVLVAHFAARTVAQASYVRAGTLQRDQKPGPLELNLALSYGIAGYGYIFFFEENERWPYGYARRGWYALDDIHRPPW